jgi:hypothetical protein
VCDLDVMGMPSKLIVIRKTAALERVRPTLALSCEKSRAAEVELVKVEYNKKNQCPREGMFPGSFAKARGRDEG